MAAPVFSLLRTFCNARTVLIKSLYRASSVRGASYALMQKQYLFVPSKKFFRCLIFSAVAFTTNAKNDPLKDASDTNRRNTSEMNFEPNDPRLRSHECLKNAAGLSVDSASAVLSQTVYAVSKIEKEYVELVNVLIVLMEYQLQVLGHTTEENRIADLIVETRHEVNKVKQRKDDLNLLFGSVEKLADATAEVAFAVGAEYASTSTGERLHSAQQEVKRVQAESEEVERLLREAQAKSIEVLSQHEEKTQRALQEQKLQSAQDNLETELMSREESTSNEQPSDNLGSKDALNEDEELT